MVTSYKSTFLLISRSIFTPQTVTRSRNLSLPPESTRLLTKDTPQPNNAATNYGYFNKLKKTQLKIQLGQPKLIKFSITLIKGWKEFTEEPAWFWQSVKFL